MDKESKEDTIEQASVTVFNKRVIAILILVATLITIPFVQHYRNQRTLPEKKLTDEPFVNDGTLKENVNYWIAADVNSIRDVQQKKQVLYGKELIMHTSRYFGPKGSVLSISNGLNCQNCHLRAGTAVFGNNYGSVASLYPKFRTRSGTVENLYRRVNDCLERSLNSKTIDTAGKEMQAIVAYINFIGSNVAKGKKAEGSGLKYLAFIDRAADPEKGKAIYTSKCQSCHQSNGEGQLNPVGNEYVYPALWGKHSFNDGAGLYRITNMAKYVKYNMPQGTTYKSPLLTDEQAWDVAAFVSAQPRPHINEPNDWPDISSKPADHPFGPFADHFSEQQHKYGPFNEMKKNNYKRKK